MAQQFRRIFSQTGDCAFKTQFTVNTTSGMANVGLSGNNGKLIDFTFESGKITNLTGNYLYSYNKNEIIEFECRISDSSYDVEFNKNLVGCGLPKETGSINYFYISDANDVLTGNNIWFSGQAPNYSVNVDNVNVSGAVITGYFVNNDPQPLFLFTGMINEADQGQRYISGYTGQLNNGETGHIYVNNISGDYTGYNHAFSLKFSGDFGEKIHYINIRSI